MTEPRLDVDALGSPPPPTEAILACEGAHARLLARLHSVDDDVVSRPSRLPGWTVGHVLTHIARNADSFVRMLEAASSGHSVQQYPGGPEQRNSEIEAGARRPAAAVVDDVRQASGHLEEVFSEAPDSVWEGSGLGRDGAPVPLRALPLRRLREVEIHHVDLGLGYDVADWPDEFVAVTLPDILAGVPGRVADPGQRAALLAWLIGREPPGEVDLAPF